MYHTYSLGSFNTNYIFKSVKILQSINQSINQLFSKDQNFVNENIESIRSAYY
jgi:hypothetical protein